MSGQGSLAKRLQIHYSGQFHTITCPVRITHAAEDKFGLALLFCVNDIACHLITDMQAASSLVQLKKKAALREPGPWFSQEPMK